jgi:hypothetical protein
MDVLLYAGGVTMKVALRTAPLTNLDPPVRLKVTE